MKSTTKRTSVTQVLTGLGIALLALGFAAGCSKKLMPPEIEANSGSAGSDSNFSSASGMNESDVGGSGGRGSMSGGSGNSGFGGGSGSGGSGSGGTFGDGSGGMFVEENVGENGSGSAPGMNGSGDRNFGDGSGGMPGNGSDGFFASNGSGAGGSGGSGSGAHGGSGSGGSGSNAFGSGSHSGSGSIGDGSGGFGNDPSDPNFHGNANGMGGMSPQEARLANFSETGEMKDVMFAYDQYDLTEDSKKILRENASWLKENPGARIEIQGHCDERGTNNYNLGLGERRALSTKKFLTALGVDGGRIFTISYGEEKPFCFESNANCWTNNRRAHFMVAR